MNEAENRYWFAARRRGWGWDAARSWQGRVVQIGYLLLVGMGLITLAMRGYHRLFGLWLLLLTVIFFALHWWKGDPAGRRGRRSTDDAPMQ